MDADQNSVPPPSPVSSQELFGPSDSEAVVPAATVSEIDEWGWKVVATVVPVEVLERTRTRRTIRLSRMDWPMDQGLSRLCCKSTALQVRGRRHRTEKRVPWQTNAWQNSVWKFPHRDVSNTHIVCINYLISAALSEEPLQKQL